MNELALFNDLFDGFGDDGFMMPTFNYKKVYSTPRVDVKQDKNAYTLEMDIPGKTNKDINIEFNRNVLTISSVNKTEKEERKEEKKDEKEGGKYLVKERTFTQFTRSFTVPEDVMTDNIAAKVVNGVLSVTLPRKAIEEPKKIAIAVQ